MFCEEKLLWREALTRSLHGAVTEFTFRLFDIFTTKYNIIIKNSKY